MGQRARLLSPARDRADPLPAAALGRGRPPAADQGHPLLGRHRLGRVAPHRRGARRPARPAADGARARRVRREDVNWLSFGDRASRPLQRGPEAQRRADGRVHGAVPRLRAAPLVRRAGHALPLREHGLPPRRPAVRVARTAARPPLPRAHPSGDAACVARDGARRGARGLGAAASRPLENGRSKRQAGGPEPPVIVGRKCCVTSRGTVGCRGSASDASSRRRGGR